MEWLQKHLGMLGNIDEVRFKRKLDGDPDGFLIEIGVEKGQTILDLGCGSGTYAIPSAKLVGEIGTIYALDVSRSALDELEERASRDGLRNIVRIHSQGQSRISIKDERIDLVLFIDALHEIDDKHGIFKEISRILKPSGILCVYPMHVDNEKVRRLAGDSDLILKSKKFDEHVLVFEKC